MPACLASVSFADDIVVVDSGSTDRTVEIAREAGCRVFIEEWRGYGPQKNSAVEKCRHDWVLILDADELIPPGTADTISRILPRGGEADAYSFPRKNYFHGRWIRYGGWPDRVIRLVKKSKGQFREITHEKWSTTGNLAETDAPIEHYSFDNYSDLLRIMETRSTEMAKELFSQGKRTNVLMPFLHGGAMFLKFYVLKMSLLHGIDGFVIAVTKAGGSFLKYAKLYELRKENSTGARKISSRKEDGLK